MYDMDRAPRGGRDCPKCMFSMEYLRNSAYLNRDLGYNTDYGVGFEPDDNPFTSALLGSPSRYLWRHFVEPLLSRAVGNYRNRKCREVLRLYPNTLICTHCRHMIKRR
jgi:hypothetical protein